MIIQNVSDGRGAAKRFAARDETHPKLFYKTLVFLYFRESII